MMNIIKVVIALLATEGLVKIQGATREKDGVWFSINYIASSTIIWLMIDLLEKYILSK